MADAFEAMTGTRPYRDQLTNGDALAELLRNCGSQFDRACVDALAEVLDLTADAEPSAIVAA